MVCFPSNNAQFFRVSGSKSPFGRFEVLICLGLSLLFLGAVSHIGAACFVCYTKQMFEGALPFTNIAPVGGYLEDHCPLVTNCLSGAMATHESLNHGL